MSKRREPQTIINISQITIILQSILQLKPDQHSFHLHAQLCLVSKHLLIIDTDLLKKVESSLSTGYYDYSI